MHLVRPDTATSHLVVSLSSEEAMILLQPGKMIRTVMDQHPKLSDRARFLSLARGGPGMLVLLPRAAGPLLLSAVDGHALEREFKGLLFDALTLAERPQLAVAG